MNERCARVGCSHGAKWHPVLIAYAEGVPRDCAPPAIGRIGLPLCDEHMTEATPAMLLTEAGFRQIRQAFREAGYKAPDRERVEVERVRMDAKCRGCFAKACSVRCQFLTKQER